jgi:hypothetical protein
VKPTQEGIIAHIRAIAHATDLPVVLYDVPSRSGVAIADDTVARLHDAELIVGLKNAKADVSRPTRLRARCGDAFMQWSGDDATAPGYRAMGGIGCISVTANVAPALCAMHGAWDNGDLGKFTALRELLDQLHAVLFRESNPIPVKAALVFRRGATATYPRHSGDAGTAAGGDAAGDAGRGTRRATAGICAGRLKAARVDLSMRAPRRSLSLWRVNMHQRASLWYADQELWTEAVQHALAAGDAIRVLTWIKNCAMPPVKRGDLFTFLGWQRLFPTGLSRGQPCHHLGHGARGPI